MKNSRLILKFIKNRHDFIFNQNKNVSIENCFMFRKYAQERFSAEKPDPEYADNIEREIKSTYKIFKKNDRVIKFRHRSKFEAGRR